MFLGMTHQEAENILYKYDSEGFAYALENGYLDSKNADTAYTKAVESCKEAFVKLDKMLEKLRKHFDIEHS